MLNSDHAPVSGFVCNIGHVVIRGFNIISKYIERVVLILCNKNIVRANYTHVNAN